jgi:hypothetical protein
MKKLRYFPGAHRAANGTMCARLVQGAAIRKAEIDAMCKALYLPETDTSRHNSFS